MIEGGNHAQFGSYGHQNGDGTATLTPQNQVQETVRVIMDVVEKRCEDYDHEKTICAEETER